MNKKYQKLVEQVRVVDEDAAKYLETDAKQLPTFSSNCSFGTGQTGLKTIFTWLEAPQGIDYWIDIYYKLEE